MKPHVDKSNQIENLGLTDVIALVMKGPVTGARVKRQLTIKCIDGSQLPIKTERHG